ncbi:hypothetical protein GCM10023082_48270 [Streptomyces tremellae]|uniref:Uncharacterized protein n=1 Tax=Streptomyces tremellae TaxID=1124239 RepID=A0ABP7FWG4_9ACTN
MAWSPRGGALRSWQEPRCARAARNRVHGGERPDDEPARNHAATAVVQLEVLGHMSFISMPGACMQLAPYE